MMQTMKLLPVSEKFILHWGEMGTRWGVNRSVAQIHALLYITGKPMPADEITETLGIARSNVSNSLKELQGWGLINVVHIMGDRRDHFDTSKNVWTLARTIFAERKQREFDPTVDFLRDCLASNDLAWEDIEAQKRIADTLQLMETVSAWGDEMLSLDPDTLVKVMKLGAKIQKLIRGN
jgi:DNA-binding transcriptional regulator GbsR (MarR family)